MAQKHTKGTHHCACVCHICSWLSVCIFLQNKLIQQSRPSRPLATGGGTWQINISWTNNLLNPSSLTSEGPYPALGLSAGTHRHRRDSGGRSDAEMLCSAVLKKKMQRWCFLDLVFRVQVWGSGWHRQQRAGASSKCFPESKPGGTMSWLLNCMSVLTVGKGLPFPVFLPALSLCNKC